MPDQESIRRWFCAEVLPLERALTRFIARNWRNPAEVADLRQEVYARVIEGVGRTGLPLQAKPYVFTAARNHLINCARRGQVVPLESIMDLGASPFAADTITPDRVLSAREELRLLQEAIDQLPPRRRQIVILRKVEGLTQKQVAALLGIAVGTVEQQMVSGMRTLVDFMLHGREARGGKTLDEERKEAGL